MRIKASVSDCGVNFVEMAPDLADNLARMGQEADVPGAFDDFEPGARNRLSKQLLPGHRHDRILGRSKHQGRNIDLPEPVGNVKVSIWARRRAMTLWSVSQIRSTTKSARGPGSGLAPCSR